MGNYDYSEKNYPKFSDEDLKRNRYRIVEDSYWNANNLKSIIEGSYDTSYVHGENNRKEEVVFALVALTCELYLKSLIYTDKDQESIVKGHDLHALFTKLSLSVQTRIKELTKEDCFDEQLGENKEVFMKFRYSYEMKGYRINASFLLRFMHALEGVCDEKLPKDILEGKEGVFICGHFEDGVFYKKIIE